MKKIAQSIFASALFAAMLVVYAVPAYADQTVEQSNDSTVKCIANSGDYGQSTNNCYIVNKQYVNQTENRNVYLKHIPVGTSTDATAMVAGMGAILSTGAGALITFKKMRA